MNLKEQDKIVFDEFDIAIAVLTDECSLVQRNEILAGAEALILMRNFREGVQSGKMKPKATCDDIDRILDKYDLND